MQTRFQLKRSTPAELQKTSREMYLRHNPQG